MVEPIAAWFVCFCVVFIAVAVIYLALVRVWRVDLYTLRAQLRQRPLTWRCDR
jgi:hypothetical protein